MRKDHTTIQDIAAVAGVSAMTVSRSLRGAPRNSPATRERILRIANEMGYRPNPLVSALMSARAGGASVTANLAILKVGDGKDVLGYTDGVLEQAEKYGYPIQEFVLKAPEMTPQRLRSILVSRGIRGIILLPANITGTDLHFDFEGFASVAIGHSILHEKLARVVSDTYLRTYDALHHLKERGYSRIGIANVPDLDRRFKHSMRAVAAVAQLAISPGMSVYTHIFEGENEYTRLTAAQRRSLCAWIKRYRLQVVVSQLDFMPEILSEEGYRIPQDLAYLHLHAHANHQITCMDQMCRFAGHKAVDIVVAAINRNELSLPKFPYFLTIPSIWRDGVSVPDTHP